MLKIATEIERTISRSLIDLVVVARAGSADRCLIFDRLVPAWKGKKYVLREFELSSFGRHGSSDLSLSFCGTVNESPFTPWQWQLCVKTPLHDNECLGSSLGIAAWPAFWSRNFRDRDQSKSPAFLRDFGPAKTETNLYYNTAINY